MAHGAAVPVEALAAKFPDVSLIYHCGAAYLLSRPYRPRWRRGPPDTRRGGSEVNSQGSTVTSHTYGTIGIVDQKADHTLCRRPSANEKGGHTRHCWPRHCTRHRDEGSADSTYNS